MILKGPEPDPNPTLFTTFYFSREIKASISYHKIDAIIIFNYEHLLKLKLNLR